MVKRKKHNKTKIVIGIIILLLLIGTTIYLLTPKAVLLGKNPSESKVFIKHGDIALTPQDLTISMEAEYNDTCIDEHDAELDFVYGLCMYECNSDLFDCYDDCDDEADEMIILSSQPYKAMQIIPAVSAIADPDSDACYEMCDETYYTEEIMAECTGDCIMAVYDSEVALGCATVPQETTTWDGTPVNDLQVFFRTRFPTGTEKYELRCEAFLGNWTETPNKIGCENFIFFDAFGTDTCGGESISSAGVVCNTINKQWTCNATKITCEN